MTRMLFILQVFTDLFVGELAAEPGVPPEQKRQEDDQPSSYEKERSIPRGHFVVRGRGGLLRRIFRGKFRFITIFWSGCRTGHFFPSFLTSFQRTPFLRN